MPYNVWCLGCGNHIGMGVRYTPIRPKLDSTIPLQSTSSDMPLVDESEEDRKLAALI